MNENIENGFQCLVRTAILSFLILWLCFVIVFMDSWATDRSMKDAVIMLIN